MCVNSTSFFIFFNGNMSQQKSGRSGQESPASSAQPVSEGIYRNIKTAVCPEIRMLKYNRFILAISKGINKYGEVFLVLFSNTERFSSVTADAADIRRCDSGTTAPCVLLSPERVAGSRRALDRSSVPAPTTNQPLPFLRTCLRASPVGQRTANTPGFPLPRLCSKPFANIKSVDLHVMP